MPAAHAGVSLGGRAAEGRGFEPARRRRRLRSHRRGVPVGLGGGPDRPRVDDPDPPVHPRLHVRDAVRAVDGLRGLPALTRARALPAHGRQRAAVTQGIARTARVITAAALIMISVFVGFVFDDDPRVKMFGLGLATAILIDATIIRLVLVPAVMQLLGDANWWLPRPPRVMRRRRQAALR